MGFAEDELISVQLDDKAYVAGAKRMAEATKQIDEQIKSVVEHAKDLGSKVLEHLKLGEAFAPLTALTTLPGLLDFGKDAYDTAAKFDALEQKIAGVTKSYERAKQLEGLAEQQAGSTGLFSVEQLESAELALEKFGLKSERYLPVIQAIGAVSGQGLDQIADAFGRMMGGDAADALSMLEKAGVTRDDLMKRGVQFNGRELAGRPEAAMPAIMSAVQDKDGQVLTDMKGSPEARAAKLAVAWESAMRRIGQAEQTILAPAIEGIAQGLEEIEKNGKLNQIVSKLQSLFSLDGKTLKQTINILADRIAQIPEKIQLIVDKIRANWPLIAEGAKIWASLWVAQKVIAFGSAVVATFQSIAASEALANSGAILFDILTGRIGLVVMGLATAAAAYAYMTDKIREASEAADEASIDASDHSPEYKSLAKKMLREKRELEDLKKGLNSGPQVGLTPEGVAQAQARKKELEREYSNDSGRLLLLRAIDDLAKKKRQEQENKLGQLPNSPVEAANGYLYQIAQNTEVTAKGFQKFAFGGGELARMGVTPMEIHKIRHSGGASTAMQRVIFALQDLLDEHGAASQRGHVANGYAPSR